MHQYGISHKDQQLSCLDAGYRNESPLMLKTHLQTSYRVKQILILRIFTAAARVRRATINERVFMSIPLSIVDTLKWMS